MGLFGLFIAAFISASLAPGGSEAALVYLITQDSLNIALTVLVATIGNTLGSLTSFALGWLAHSKKSPQELIKGKENKALSLIERYGIWSLLLAWLPLIGDALPLLAGWFRFGIVSSTLMIFIGKLARYTVVALIASGVVSQF